MPTARDVSLFGSPPPSAQADILSNRSLGGSSRTPLAAASNSHILANSSMSAGATPTNSRPSTASFLQPLKGSPSSIDGRASRQKMQEIGSRMAEIDGDIEGQSQVRRHRDQRLEAMSGDFGVQQKLLRMVEERVMGLEEFGQRLERGLNGERDSCEVLEKTTLKALDDRQRQMLQKVESEKSDRDSALTDLRKRVLQAEDHLEYVSNVMEENRKNMRQSERSLSQANERLCSLENTVEAEQVKRMHESNGQLQALNNSVQALQQMVMTESQVRDKEMEKMKTAISRECEELKRALGMQIQDREHQTDRRLNPLSERIHQLHSDMETEKKEAELEAAAAETKLSRTIDELRNQIEQEIHGRSQEGDVKFKSIDDTLWKLNYNMDREKEGREKQVKALGDSLDGEKFAREEAEETLARLLDATIERFRAGMDAAETRLANAQMDY